MMERCVQGKNHLALKAQKATAAEATKRKRQRLHTPATTPRVRRPAAPPPVTGDGRAFLCGVNALGAVGGIPTGAAVVEVSAEPPEPYPCAIECGCCFWAELVLAEYGCSLARG